MRRRAAADERAAACACGGLSAVCRGEPRVALCHCDACKRRTGSAFGLAAFYPLADVTLSGEFRTYVRRADSGSDVIHRFCPVCGGTVCWETTGKPGTMVLAVGAFADATFPVPVKQAAMEACMAWLHLSFS